MMFNFHFHCFIDHKSLISIENFWKKNLIHPISNSNLQKKHLTVLHVWISSAIMNDKNSKFNESEKQKQIESFQSRRKRFNIHDNTTKKSDISNTFKTLIYGFMHNIIDKKSSLYTNDLPTELLILIYSFYRMSVIHFGIRFYYWDYYKNLNELSDTDLYINAKYSSLKQ
eukprot:446112_1